MSFSARLRRYLSRNLNNNLNPSVLNHHFISFNCTATSQAFTSANIEAPAVPVAFDCVVAEMAVRKRRTFVRAEVFDGVEFIVDVEERKLRLVRKSDGCAASRRHIFHAPDDDKLSFALRLLQVG